jgi:hypothetical protein
MKNFKIFFKSVLIVLLWAYVTSFITDNIFNRPMNEFIQMFFSLFILTYSFLCFHYIYKLLFNNFKIKNND